MTYINVGPTPEDAGSGLEIHSEEPPIQFAVLSIENDVDRWTCLECNAEMTELAATEHNCRDESRLCHALHGGGPPFPRCTLELGHAGPHARRTP